MSDQPPAQPSPHPPAQPSPHPPYPVQPMPVQYQVGIATLPNNVKLVALTLMTMNSHQTFFLNGDAAAQLGAAINRNGREVMAWEQVTQPKIVMPDGSSHIVRPEEPQPEPPLPEEEPPGD